MADSSDEDSQSISPDETGSTTSSAPLAGLKVVLKLKRSASGKAGQSPSKRGRPAAKAEPRSATKEPPVKEEKSSPESSTADGSEEPEVPEASPSRGRGRGRGRGGGRGRGRGRGRGGSRLTLPRKRRKPTELPSTLEANEGEESEEGGEENEEGEDVASETNEPAPAEAAVKNPEFVAPLPITPGDLRHRKSAVGLTQDSWLTKVLTYLHRYLQRKDTQGFFGEPVDDEVAPGYSQIISQPMDFSTMLLKIEARRYANIIDFKRDFKLMCANAMRYNAEETIYYKAAKRLLQLGLKLLSKERLTSLRTTLIPMAQLTPTEMGFDYTKVKVSEGEAGEGPSMMDQDDAAEISPPTAAQPPIPPVRYEERELSAEEITEKCNANRQKMLGAAQAQGRRPAQLGYLRKNADKSTSLVFVPPEGGTGVISDTERVVNLGEYTSQIQYGQPNLHGVNSFKELPHNEIRPITYHDYGSFCSFAPSYDSTFATLSPEDSATLLSAYGTDMGVLYATSIKRFVRKAGPVAKLIVDGRLESATGGTHSATGLSIIEAKLDEIDRLNKAAEAALPTDSLLNCVGVKLEAVSDLQVDRLSQPPTEHLRLTQGPSPRESELANSAVKDMVELAQSLRPGDLVEDPMVIRSLLTTFAI